MVRGRKKHNTFFKALGMNIFLLLHFLGENEFCGHTFVYRIEGGLIKLGLRDKPLSRDDALPLEHEYTLAWRQPYLPHV